MKNNNIAPVELEKTASYLNLSAKHSQYIIWTLLCLMPISGMAIDLVAPSLPSIAKGLHVSTYAAKSVISIYLAGYALGNFFTGFLADAKGRQKLLRISLLGFIIASFLPTLINRIEFLLLARFLQGLTIGSVALLVRAICSDVLPPEKLVRFGSMIATMWGLGPVIGPILGGYLQSYFGWKAGFYFFALISLVGFIAAFIIIPETHFNRHPIHIKTIKKNLLEVINHRLFVALIVLMGLAYSLIIAFNTMGPFLIQSQLHYSPIFFGHLALCLGLTFLASTFVCRYFLRIFQAEQIYYVVINLAFCIAVILVIISYFFKNSIVLIAVTSGLMFIISSVVFPVSMGKGMSLFRHIAGTASATMFLINMLITSLTASLVGFISIQDFTSLMWVYVLLLAGCMLIYWLIIRNKSD